MTFSEHLACTHCGISFDELAPRNFSFNSPYGACERCDGLGTRFEVDPELVVPNDDLSISEGAIAAWSGFRSHYFERVLESVAAEHDVLARHAVEEVEEERRRTRCCTAPVAHRSRCPTGTVTVGSARTPRSSRASCRGSSVGTRNPRAIAPASRSRATCARCRAPRATVRGFGPRRSR